MTATINPEENSRANKRAAEDRSKARSATLPLWPADVTANQVINQGKKEKSHEPLPL